MQKLEQRTKKNTPTDTPQVRGNCGLSLNREETLSVTDLKTRSNNPEVDLLQQRTGGLKAKVYVLSITNSRLMPCSSAKARKLLKKGRAKTIKLYPFTIKLTFECENQVQGVKLGMDSGYKNVGFSAITEKEELLCGTLILDGKTSERLTEKRMYRRSRRIENQDICGVEYQQGDMFGYQNERAYLIAREHGLCQLCHKGFSKGNPSHIHHCKQRNEAGSNRVKNKAILHEKCHIKLHRQGLKLAAPKSLKPETFMSIIHKKFQQDIPDVKITFGYVTFVKRNEIGLPKTHYNDAFVIAEGQSQGRCKPIEIKQKHRNNRAIQMNRKGFKPSIRKQRYSIQPKDLIWINGKRYVAIGIQNRGEYVKTENSKKAFAVKSIEQIYNFGSYAFT